MRCNFNLFFCVVSTSVLAGVLSSPSLGQQFQAPLDVVAKFQAKPADRVDDRYPPLKVVNPANATQVVVSDRWQPLDSKCDGIEVARDEWNKILRDGGNPDLGPIVPTLKFTERKTKDKDRFLTEVDGDQYSHITEVRIVKNVVQVRGQTYGRFLERTGPVIEELKEIKYPPVSGGVGVATHVLTGGAFVVLDTLLGGPSKTRFDFGCTSKGITKKYILVDSAKLTGRYSVREVEREHVVAVSVLGQTYNAKAESTSSGFLASIEVPDAAVLSVTAAATVPLVVECTSCRSSGYFSETEPVPAAKIVQLEIALAPLRDAALIRIAEEKAAQEKERRAELARREQLRREEQAKQEQQRLAEQAERERKKKQAQLETMRSI